ncbi:MAG: class I SAM-dependent methyltransferase [Chiayiivirga sp.]|jgi:SAM-dependent methyltransferase|uniref:class I SAM-dependent methyltransferase n=1 Tax=Chiayiivirga sp. TaxID=2041042 RepID=UPI0025BD0C47|nr:class I SAM-dependent methyltransferase [Chiayiivirga sp.]MCI1709976.1 class I SAM-dependent methyltransferase [Chiayiivirga sp.]MCI1730399.1 class I SAM-dependent methyltransferase [Chiayiivirga sp.]
MSQGWDASAQAWIDVIGVEGDWGRKYVLDTPMLARVAQRGFRDALDLGCGEGRFCRMMQAQGVGTIGIDPTAALIEQARRRDPDGDYRVMAAEALALPDAGFDLVVAYLSLIDIANLPAAIAEVRRVLRPGGRFLIANLQPFNTAAIPLGWTREPDGTRRFCIDHYLQERAIPTEWRGIRILNWHRPLQAYLSGLLAAGFDLRHFDEPGPQGVTDDKAQRYRRVPNFLVMEWQKA